MFRHFRRRMPHRSIALIVAVGTLGPAAAVEAQELLYVASQEEVTVAVIDMRSHELIETVDLKALGYSETAKAHHTAVEPDGSHWYVSLIAAGKVLKFDRDNRLVGEADFETPGMLSLDPESDLMYVGRSMAAVNPPQRVGVIDRSTMELEEVDVFFPRPHALIVDTHGDRFFSASLGQNSIAYAPLGEEEVDLLGLDGMNHMLVQFAVSPDGNWMVSGGQMTGDLLIFDLSGDEPEVVNSIDVGGQPWHPSFTPDGRFVWIPNQAANTVTVVDTESWTVARVSGIWYPRPKSTTVVLGTSPANPAEDAEKELLNRKRVDALNPETTFRYARLTVPLCRGAFSEIDSLPSTGNVSSDTHEYVPPSVSSSVRNHCIAKSLPNRVRSPTFR